MKNHNQKIRLFILFLSNLFFYGPVNILVAQNKTQIENKQTGKQSKDEKEQSNESYLVKKYPALFERIDKTDTIQLIIKTGKGRPERIYQDTSDAGYLEYFQLEEYYPTQQTALIRVVRADAGDGDESNPNGQNQLEFTSYILVHLPSNQEMPLDDLPNFSPDKNRFYTINPLVNDKRKSVKNKIPLQVFQITKQKIRQDLIDISVSNMGDIRKVAWFSNQSIILITRKSSSKVNTTVKIIFDKNSWKQVPK